MAEPNSEYVYIGKFFHRKDKELDLSEKKIGRTNNLKVREYELNRTRAPIGYIMIAAWCTGDDTVKVESGIHALLNHDRSVGEWFEDDNDDADLVSRVRKYMEIHDYPEVSFDDITAAAETDADADAKQAIRNERQHAEKVERRDRYFYNATDDKSNPLVGETFSLTVGGQTVAIRIDGNDNFYCPGTNLNYPGTLHNAFVQAGRELSGNPNYAGTNAWDVPKNADDKSADERLEECDQQAQKNAD